jgi:hypothetical protein
MKEKHVLLHLVTDMTIEEGLLKPSEIPTSDCHCESLILVTTFLVLLSSHGHHTVSAITFFLAFCVASLVSGVLKQYWSFTLLFVCSQLDQALGLCLQVGYSHVLGYPQFGWRMPSLGGQPQEMNSGFKGWLIPGYSKR